MHGDGGRGSAAFLTKAARFSRLFRPQSSHNCMRCGRCVLDDDCDGVEDVCGVETCDGLDNDCDGRRLAGGNGDCNDKNPGHCKLCDEIMGAGAGPEPESAPRRAPRQ